MARKTNRKKLLRKKSITKQRKILYYLSLGLIWLICLIFLYLIYLFLNIPDVNNAKLVKHKTVKFYDNNNQLITQYGTLQDKPIKYKQIPSIVISALLSTEDNNFFEHNGLDLIAVVRATFSNIMFSKLKQGGSTITQQLAKIIYLNSEKTLSRKLQELILAFYLEYKYNKEEILEMYLNNAYFGSGIYGIEGAARYYFGKELKQINPLEASMLIGMLKAPTAYNPLHNPDKSLERTLIVLKNMTKQKFITMQEYAYWSNYLLSIEPLYIKNSNILYFTDFLMEKYQEDISALTNINIKTYIDSNLQRKIEKLVEEKKSILESKNISQIAIIVTTHQGEIIAYLGGMNYHISPFNRASKMKRQSGSLFKIFTYLTAFENGYGLNDEVEDKYIKIGQWSPRNYTRKYYGKLELKDAFAKSLNTVSVQLTEKIGRNQVIKTAKKFGINSKLTSYPSLSLGVDLLSLEELTKAYNIIANKCHNTDLKFVRKINNTSYANNNWDNKKVCSDSALSKIDHLLKYNMQLGTGKTIGIKNAAGKSGTTSNYKDAWFIGYNNTHTISIWMGNDDNKPMDKITGGSLPANLWKEIALLLNDN